MFTSKKMHNKIVSAKENEIRELQRKIDKQEESQKDLREEIENEHLENYKNHRKLLEIEKVLQEQDYNSIENLKKYIHILTEREREIIEKRYGLKDDKEITQKEIAKQLGISRSYVSRIEKRALTKLLREFMKNKSHD